MATLETALSVDSLLLCHHEQIVVQPVHVSFPVLLFWARVQPVRHQLVGHSRPQQGKRTLSPRTKQEASVGGRSGWKEGVEEYVAFPTDCANNSLGLFGYPLRRNRNFNFTVEAEANVGSKSHPLLETSLRKAQKPKHPDHRSKTHNSELDHFRHSNTKATKTRDFIAEVRACVLGAISWRSASVVFDG